jgi:hypothetical protein
MDPAQGEKIWRITVVILYAASLLISALAFYGIRRLEADRKPHVHMIREVHPLRVDAQGHPVPSK